MFDERAAMKMRLGQIQDLEIRIIQEFQKERSQILNRIRELDEEGDTTSATSKTIKSEATFASDQVKAKSQRRKNKRKHNTLTKEAIKVLKEHSAAISGKEIAATVEKSTGKSVGNITQFMNRVMTTDSKVLTNATRCRMPPDRCIGYISKVPSKPASFNNEKVLDTCLSFS